MHAHKQTQHVGVCFVQPARRTGRPRGGSQPPFRNGPLSGDRPGGSNGTKCSSSGDAGCGICACDCHSNSRLRVRALAGGLQTFHMCSKGNANASASRDTYYKTSRPPSTNVQFASSLSVFYSAPRICMRNTRVSCTLHVIRMAPAFIVTLAEITITLVAVRGR